MDTPRQVQLIDNHDEALLLWNRAGADRRLLIHVDAHHDMCWTPDAEAISIANFICLALRERIVREVFWVVPDPTWLLRSNAAPCSSTNERTSGRPSPVPS